MTKIKVKLSLVEFKENSCYIVYSPALDISGYAKTAKDARNSFKEALNYFLEYTIESNTLYQELRRLGWNVENEKITPPNLKNLVKFNPNFVNIYDNHSLKTKSKQIEMPLIAV
jgi:hypothetical protein